MIVKCQLSGEELLLDDSLPLGRGGEGVIYTLPNSPDLAAKIYHPDKMNAERVGKLKAMLANAPDDPVREKQGHASIAWPVELVTTRNGNRDVIGFLMPLLPNARPLSDLSDVTERQTRFPLFSYRALCRTASNLASAVRAIHQSGYVIGDVNDSNILVTSEAMVTLVDTDSFQVIEQPSGRIYRCPVGTNMFTPPELLGKSFKDIDRSPEHDLFGLAVLFFQLLMEGTHPFACIFRGAGDAPEYLECVTQGYFPYGGHPMCDPSRLAPPFEMLHPTLQALFRQCFVDGHTDPRLRPEAATWHRALKEGEQALTVCSHNGQHYYFDHCTACPWCERAQLYRAAKPNWDPFPPRQRASQYANFSYAGQASASSQRSTFSGQAHGQAPVSPGAPPPQAHAFFSASASRVALGQAVTIRWDVPHAQTVRITDQSGRRIFAGHGASGFVTIYPTKTRTYRLAASGMGVILPSPITVFVTQVPLPVALKQPQLELHQPISLREVHVGLRSVVSLGGITARLRSPLKLKSYLPLGKYIRLKNVWVSLNTP